MRTRKSAKRGFTLVEILIVVIILGILAAIVIPQFANASSDARITSLRTSLNNVRNQIEVFKAQHNETAPALAGMWTLLTGQSDTTEANSAAPTGTHWGPYLQAAPLNPLNSLDGVSSAAVDPNAGWYYQPIGLGFTFYSRNADGSVNTAY
jgi:general secretion pathway protein G